MKPLLLLALFLQVGCSTARHAQSPTVTVSPTTLGSQPQVVLGGDATKPAKVDTAASVTELPIPANTQIVFDATLGTYKLLFALPSSMKTTANHVTIDGPTAFTPPAPPTPSELADGKLNILYGVGMFLGAALAIFGLVRNWNLVMYGGGAILGACLLGKFINTNPTISLIVIAVGVCLVVGGPYIWNKYGKHLEPTTDATRTERTTPTT